MIIHISHFFCAISPQIARQQQQLLQQQHKINLLQQQIQVRDCVSTHAPVIYFLSVPPRFPSAIIVIVVFCFVLFKSLPVVYILFMEKHMKMLTVIKQKNSVRSISVKPCVVNTEPRGIRKQMREQGGVSKGLLDQIL